VIFIPHVDLTVSQMKHHQRLLTESVFFGQKNMQEPIAEARTDCAAFTYDTAGLPDDALMQSACSVLRLKAFGRRRPADRSPPERTGEL
jgi:hypothetical protein